MSGERLEVTERDIRICDVLSDMRFLTIDQLAVLHFPSRAACDLRLRRLREAGYLVALPWGVGAAGTARLVYALARKGAELLRPRRGGDLAPFHRATERRGAIFLEHLLMRNNVWVVLELLHRELAVQLVAFRHQPHEISVSMALKKARGVERRVAVPDAFCAVLARGECHAFLVEVDRATVPLRRMRERYELYNAAWRSGAMRAKFGGAPLRVLTLTTTREHARSLASVAPKSSLFWFSTIDAIDIMRPRKFLEAEWLTGDGIQSTLFK